MENKRLDNIETEKPKDKRIFDIWEMNISPPCEGLWWFQGCYPSLGEVESQYSIKGHGSPENERCLVIHPDQVPEEDKLMLAEKSYVLLCEEIAEIYRIHYSMVELSTERGLAKEIVKYISKNGPGSRSKIKIARAFDLTKVGIRETLKEHGLEAKLK